MMLVCSRCRCFYLSRLFKCFRSLSNDYARKGFGKIKKWNFRRVRKKSKGAGLGNFFFCANFGGGSCRLPRPLGWWGTAPPRLARPCLAGIPAIDARRFSSDKPAACAALHVLFFVCSAALPVRLLHSSPLPAFFFRLDYTLFQVKRYPVNALLVFHFRVFPQKL